MHQENLGNRPAGMAASHGEMKIISFISERDVIRKILEHLGLWQAPSLQGALVHLKIKISHHLPQRVVLNETNLNHLTTADPVMKNRISYLWQ